MLKISFIQLILRGIPESIIYFLAVFAFTKNRIQIKKYVWCCAIMALVGYVLKFLPIQNGVDYILNLIILITLSVLIIKVDVIEAIRVSIVLLIFGFIFEGINAFVIQYILGVNLNVLGENVILDAVCFYPSIVIFGVIVILYYRRLLKRKELRDISYGKIDQQYS